MVKTGRRMFMEADAALLTGKRQSCCPLMIGGIWMGTTHTKASTCLRLLLCQRASQHSSHRNSSILNHTFHTPDVTSYVATDGILIPTGELPGVEGTPLDFRTARTIGSELNETLDVCGTGCTGETMIQQIVVGAIVG